MWGGGGAGGSTGSGQAPSGTDSTLTVNGTEIMNAGGGAGGFQDYSDRWHRGHFTAAGGAGGGARGGKINLFGKHGVYGGWTFGESWGGDSGGYPDYGTEIDVLAGQAGRNWGASGRFPGGGGAGFQYGGGGGKFSWACGGGGGGGYTRMTWNLRDISAGGGMRFKTKWYISVGFGGNPEGRNGNNDGGHGADGLVRINWH